MGESERKGKEAGELKAAHQKETFINEKKGRFFIQSLSGAFIAKAPLQITKNCKSKHYYKEKVGRKPKKNKK